jgi:hypothetical protein
VVRYKGLYPESPDSLSCCWIAPRAEIFVRKSREARELVLGFFVIDRPVFEPGQQVAVTVPESSAWTATLGPGQHLARIPLGQSARRLRGLIPIAITSRIDYVPSREGSSEDNRHFGVVLLYAYFQ